jgi:rhodanese-related sulfurtransferase
MFGHFGGGAQQAQNFDHKFMTVEEMKANGGLIVDIRTPPEWYQSGVIEGARLVPFQDPQSFLAEIKDEIADGRDVILVCRSGNRTAIAGQYLMQMIPNKIISIAGGMIQVVGSGYEPVAPQI